MNNQIDIFSTTQQRYAVFYPPLPLKTDFSHILFVYQKNSRKNLKTKNVKCPKNKKKY